MGLNFIRGFAATFLILIAFQAMSLDKNSKSSGGGGQSGTVLETMDSGGYTYVKLEQNGKQFWAALPKTKVAVGASLRFKEDMRMKNFTSKTLNRSFDELLFISRTGETSGAPVSAYHPPSTSVTEVVNEPISKAEGGYTVAEVFAKKDELKGKVIKVRGKVVKVSMEIMGNNWVHLKDGTGSAGTDKIIFRSPDNQATVGNVVTAEGTVDTNKDFGYGYKYDVLIEKSTFTE